MCDHCTDLVRQGYPLTTDTCPCHLIDCDCFDIWFEQMFGHLEILADGTIKRHQLVDRAHLMVGFVLLIDSMFVC